ncbi:hypothetical protein QKC54_gp0868 [Megavirus baoshan]|uniref:Uncharacterized protein n=1 Tax=Megavirus baoshan TaxID=2496520 RepID=A0A8K1W7A8_9VIRU|nr:hypothetical protein QKC54_gp0868 [Megavirus baoshan]UFX99763.1 hypothetical protein Mb0204 [Megavirus baoshan]
MYQIILSILLNLKLYLMKYY